MIDHTTFLARPARIRFSLWDATGDSTCLKLPAQRLWWAGGVVAFMFAIFAGVEWTTISSMSRDSVRDMFDLMVLLFQGFWVLAWSVAVAILGALTVGLLFYDQSARLQQGRLIFMPRLGPLRVFVEYDLALVHNVRVEPTATVDKGRVRFDYEQGSAGLGTAMPRADAERLVRTIQNAVAGVRPMVEPAGAMPVLEPQRPNPIVQAPVTSKRPMPPMSPSGLALIAANLVPLMGVLLFRWDLASVMVLFWAESAVIGFYTVLKLAIVGKFGALLAAPFFLGHFGGFMTGHFLFIYMFFVRGVGATGPDSDVRKALLDTFIPIWTSLCALFNQSRSVVLHEFRAAP